MRRCIIILSAVLLLGSRSVATQIPASESGSTYLALFESTCRTLVCALSRRIAERFGGTSVFAPQSDGGGDGGGDGSGGSDGGGDGSDGNGGASDGGGDSGGDSGNGAGNDDGTGTDTGTVGDMGDQSDAAATTLGDPTNDAVTDPAAIAIDDPAQSLRGPGSPGSGDNSFLAAVGPLGPTENFAPQPPGTSGPTAPVDVAINAVIVSGVPTPWDAIGKARGVRNVIVTGGIVALGEAPLSNTPLSITIGSPDNPPAWLKFKPDLRYLNGSVFPPIVPNVIDIRIISYTEEAIQSANN